MYASVWIYKLMKRNDDSVELSRYEKGIKNLIDTFVNSSEILMPLLRVRGRGRERVEVAQCVGKSAMSRERDDDAERSRERSKRAKKKAR